MYKETLRSIDGVSLFPVIAILIFVIFFLIVLYFVIRMDKKKVQEFSALPLENGGKQPNTLTPSHNTSVNHV
ncbi:MAG: cbb3-type cytochrome c oxidase subunit 3 [Bacteroidota bacterium]